MKPNQENKVRREQRSTGTTGADTTTLDPTTILTVEQVAARLQIPKSSVYEKTRFRGARTTALALPHRRVGKYLRFVASEVDAWFLSLPQSAPKSRRRYRKADQAARA
jgi:predicted DNA-binding transcriptional regulator AlpA